MGKVDEYRIILREKEDIESFLLEESRLPGPRANLELAIAYALENELSQFKIYADLDFERAPQNTAMEFLAFCGTLGLGYHLADDQEIIRVLREKSSDHRWRIREAVMLGLQRWGRDHPDELFELMSNWAMGSSFEKRAAVAAICEPELLMKMKPVSKVYNLLDYVTSSIIGTTDKNEGFIALRKALGYCWSVAVSAHPTIGKPHMEQWIGSDDKDVRWVMKQNLSKKRLIRLDGEWVSAQRKLLDG